MILSLTSFFSSGIGLYIFIGIATLGLFLIIFSSILNKKRNERVLLVSPYIEAIRDLNKQYAFQSLSRTADTKTYHLNSKRAFDNFDFYKNSTQFIKDNLSYYQQIVEKIDFNRSTYAEYNQALSRIKPTKDETLAKVNKMSLKSFNTREIKLGTKYIKRPQTTYTLRIQWEYTSPAGRNHYCNYRDFSVSNIKNVVQKLTASQNKIYQPESRNENVPTYSRPQIKVEKVYTNDDIEDVED